MFSRKLQKNAMVAVCPDEAGVAVARVRRNRDSTPNLELCQVQEMQNLSLQGAEIAQLTRRYHLERQVCITTLDLGAYSMLVVEAPEVPEEELAAAIRWRIKDLIDFNIEEAAVDFFEVPNQKAVGRRMLNADVGRSEAVQSRINLLKQAGLALQVVDIPEMAMRNIAVLLPEDVAGMGLLYLGRREGLITITRQETLYLSRRIDIGYESFEAEVAAGETAMIERRMDSIVVEIQRSMDFYDSNFSQPPLANIVIAPLGTPIPGIESYIQNQLGIHCRLMDLNSIIDSDSTIDPHIQSRCFMAIGAALRDEATA